MSETRRDTRFFQLAQAAGRRPFFASLRVRLLLLVLLALSPAFGLIFYSALATRQRNIRMAQEEALRIARLAASHHEQLIEGTHQLLLTLAQLPIVQSNDAEACTTLFTNLLSQLGRQPIYANFAAARPDGQLFASALQLTGAVTAVDRPYFQEAVSNRHFALGDYQLGRVTGKHTRNAAYPAIDGAGNLRAVVIAALDLSWFPHLITNAALPVGSSVTVVDRDGVTLVRYPDPMGQFVGTSVLTPPRTNSANIPLRMEGTSVFAGRDRVRRFYAWRALGPSPEQRLGAVTVGIPTQTVYAPANRMLWRHVALLAAVTAGALAATWYLGEVFVLRRVKTLLGVTGKLSSGDLSVRTGETDGTGELYQLSRAFDAMAESLQERVAERERAEAELKRLNQELEGRVEDRTQELKRSNQDLEQFAYVASHDLQEPLRMVTSYLQLLDARYGDKLDKDAHEFIGFAKEGAERMTGLIKDLLQYSRVSTKAREFAPVECDEALNLALSNLRLALEETGAQVQREPLPRVMGDVSQLAQLFQNLISNALKFRGEKSPVVRIRAQPQKGRWQFEVKDNGIGIERKHFERIFVIFQRLHTREQYPGSGIGLALCKKIVERHGGKIWLESELGQGATFVFTLAAVK